MPALVLNVETSSRFGLVSLASRVITLRIFIFDDQRETPAIGRPVKGQHRAFEIGENLRFTAQTIEHPDLSRRILVIALRGEKSEVFAVGTPARVVFARAGIRELNLLLAVPAAHPNVSDLLVFVVIARRHGVGDPIAFG